MIFDYDDDGYAAVRRFFGGYDLLDRFLQRQYTGHENDDRDERGGQVLDSAVPVRMLFIGSFSNSIPTRRWFPLLKA